MTPQQIEAMKLALKALEFDSFYGTKKQEAITAIKEALAQPEQDSTYTYASSLATAIWQKHYMKESPKWKPLDTTEGVLTQIDNMACGLVREKPAQPEQEPVMWSDYESNGIHHKPVAQTQEPFAYINVEKRRLEFAHPYVKWDTPTTVKLDKIPLYTKETFLQLIKELRPAIKPLEGMGRGKTTEEWFDILVQAIEEKNT